VFTFVSDVADWPVRLSWMPFDNFRTPHHILTCCTLITALLAVNFDGSNIFCPQQNRSHYRVLLGPKFTTWFPFTHQLILWIASDWILHHLLPITPVMKCYQTPKNKMINSKFTGQGPLLIEAVSDNLAWHNNLDGYHLGFYSND